MHPSRRDETLLQAGADKSGGASGPGAMLSILHLNGCKISNPTFVAGILQMEDCSLRPSKHLIFRLPKKTCATTEEHK
jgi:hypothetical protein